MLLLVLRAFGIACALLLSAPTARADRRIHVIHHVPPTAVPTWGPPTAPVTIDFVFDPADSQSVTVYRLLKNMRRRHPTRLRTRFRAIGRGGRPGVLTEAVHAAHAHGLFFRFLDELYHDDRPSPRRVAPGDVARAIGMDPGALTGDTYAERIRSEYFFGRRYRVRSTPSLLVNGRMYAPHEPQLRVLSALETAYDEGLSRARDALARGVPEHRLTDVLLRSVVLDHPPIAPTAGRVDGPMEADTPEASFAVRPAPPSAASAARGPASARVELRFHCRFFSRNCMTQNTVIDELRAAYPSELRVVFEPLLPKESDSVIEAHEEALCARAQGAFWPAYDAAFAQFSRPEGDRAKGWQRSHEIDAKALEQCMGKRTYRRQLEAAGKRARKRGVKHTPTVVIAGRAYVGTQSFEVLRGVIDQALAPGVLETLAPSRR